MTFARISGLALVVATAALTAGVAVAACPGVTHTTLYSQSWQVDSFFEEGTSNPLFVTLIVDAVDSDTDLQYFDGSAWIAVTGPVSVSATRVRATIGGSATIRYQKGICEEDVHLQDV